MAPIPNSLTGLSFLREPGGILSNLPAQVTAKKLETASLNDVVSLSMAAVQKQQVDELFGTSPPSGPGRVPEVAPAGLAKAAPEQQAALYQAATRYSQMQGLLGQQAAGRGRISVMG
jgi:hypothetical protein